MPPGGETVSQCILFVRGDDTGTRASSRPRGGHPAERFELPLGGREELIEQDAIARRPRECAKVLKRPLRCGSGGKSPVALSLAQSRIRWSRSDAGDCPGADRDSVRNEIP